MKRWSLFATLAIMLAARAAAAAETLDVTVDKGTLLRLETNAKIVLLAQPAIADAVIESPRLIFILGRRPGETNLFVLDARGRVIVEADVVVRANGPRHVSIHRGTSEATLSCAPRCSSVATPGVTRRRAGGRASGASGASSGAPASGTRSAAGSTAAKPK